MNAVATRNRPTTGPATFTTRSSTLVTYSVVTASDSSYGSERWYEPATARWLSNDPIGISGGLNQYVFCIADPVNSTDTDGLWTEEAHRNLGRFGHDRFDYSRLDRDFPATGTYANRRRHFRQLGEAIRDARDAATRGDVTDFEYHVHEVQDYFSHTAAGYGPKTGHWTTRPDDPMRESNRERYRQADEITRRLEDLWDRQDPPRPQPTK